MGIGHRRITRAIWAMLITNLADCISTVFSLQNGLVEANPLLAPCIAAG